MSESFAGVGRAATSLRHSAEDELASLRSKVEQLLSERVKPTLSDAAGQAEVLARNAGAQATEQMKRLSETVQTRPLAAIGVAAFAGFVAAMLVRR